MKKNKLLAGLLAVSLLVGMAVPAFATGEADTVGAPEVEQGTTGGAEESGTGGTTEPETPAEIPEVPVTLDFRGPGTGGNDIDFDYAKAYSAYMTKVNVKDSNEITITLENDVIAALEGVAEVSDTTNHATKMNKALLAAQSITNKIAVVGVKIGTPKIGTEEKVPTHLQIGENGDVMKLEIHSGEENDGAEAMAGYFIYYPVFARCDEAGKNWSAVDGYVKTLSDLRWLSSATATDVIGVTPEVRIKFRNHIDTASTDWNTGDADEYGKVVSYVNGKTTLKATSVKTDTHYYAPYTTFGRGKDKLTFGDGFETTATFDVSGMENGDQMYWETGLNGTTSNNANPSISTRLEKKEDGKIEVVDIFHNEGGTHTESTHGQSITGNTITIKTTVEPFNGKVRFTSNITNGTNSLKQIMFIKGAPTAYGSARYGWVYFNKASKTVGVSGVAYRDLTAPEAATEAEKAALTKAIADAKVYAASVFPSTDGADVAKTKLWATQAAIEAYNKVITEVEAAAKVAVAKDEVAALSSDLSAAKTTLAAKSGTKEPVVATVPDVTGSSGSGTTTIPDAVGKGDDIVATLPTDSIKNVITAADNDQAPKAAEITVTLPAADKGTVTSIKVPADVFTAAAAAKKPEAQKIVFEVKDSESAPQVKWEFDTTKGTADQFAAINLVATPKQDAKVVLDTTVEGLDTSAPAKADLIKFEHSGTIPAGTKVTVPTTVTGTAKAYAYSILANGKVDLSSEVEVTINGTNAEFTPKHFSDILISASKITPVAVNPGPPPPYVGPSTRPSYSGSATPTTTPSTDLTTIIENTAISANTVKGTKVEVPSSISDPTFDSKEIALNAPEAKAFVDTAANSGFAFAKVFQMNLFDGKTKVTKVEDGKVKISIPFAGKAGYEYVVLRYETNGGITAMPALYKDGQITFTTNHFSLYAIAVKSTNKNLFADTTVKPGTPTPGGTTSVPQTSACTLTKLF